MSETAASKHRQPRTLEQATAMLERFAVLDGDRAAIEAERNEQIAKINAASDEQLVPIVEEIVAIGEKVQPWWAKAAAELLPAKRKSMELGGCIIGSRTGKTVLAIAGAEDALIAALTKLRWGKVFAPAKPKLDKTALLKATDGPRADDLKTLGVTAKAGEESFVLARAEQSGTIGSGA